MTLDQTVREVFELVTGILAVAWVGPRMVNHIREWCALSYWMRVLQLAGIVAGMWLFFRLEKYLL